MRFVVPMLILMLTGCFTTPVPFNEATSAPSERVLAFQNRLPNTTSTIVITRDTGFEGSGCYYAVSINGTLAVRLDTGEMAQFYMEPGEIRLKVGRDPYGVLLCSVRQDDWIQREAILRPYETKYFRVFIDPAGDPDIQRAEP